ncbi:hypothetical protein FHG87_016684 [Trinorchestia longiramus]|nr:hypothetical protein FHG87_016684 [Trinorchestia longiramus]
MMLEIVDGYSRDFKVKFGGDKSKVMVINGDETDRDREWNIGEVKIDRTKEYKYLGCMLSEDGCARAKGEKVRRRTSSVSSSVGGSDAWASIGSSSECIPHTSSHPLPPSRVMISDGFCPQIGYTGELLDDKTAFSVPHTSY